MNPQQQAEFHAMLSEVKQLRKEVNQLTVKYVNDLQVIDAEIL